MTTTEIKIVQDKTFQTIVSVVDKMVNMAKPTYGPASNKVIISTPLYRMVVDDGVQIARDFKLQDPVEQAVVDVIKETAIKTNDRVGDGTTSSLIMLQAIIREVARKSRFSGRSVELELKKAVEEVKKQLRAAKRDISTKDELKKVAMVSFDDEEIAEMIADAYHKIGKNGIITIDKSPSAKTTVEMTDGTKIDTGFISPYMVNNPERMEAVIEKPYILLTDYRITENSDLMPLMNKMAKENKRGLVIIAENVEQHALATLVINQPHVVNGETHKTGTFPSIAIALPKVESRDVLLEDLAILTGAKVFSVSKGDKLENATIEDLGRAEKFISRREESIIVEPKGDKEKIKGAVQALEKAIEAETIEKRRKELEYRIGLFTNSLAVIKVGAPTENEQKALKYKVEDCVNAVKEAYRGGVVCGGGHALARLKTSSHILNEALQYPRRQLFENMGMDEFAHPQFTARPKLSKEDLEKLKSSQPGEVIHVEDDKEITMNVVTNEIGNFMEVGVMDPVEVLIAGVESAVSIASVLLTSHGMIVEHQKQTETR